MRNLDIQIKDDQLPTLDQVLSLYQDVGWTAYTKAPHVLWEGLKCSLKVWTAWQGDQLVGLARVVGDGKTIVYLQDLLVLEAYQRQGVGSSLLELVVATYRSVRQIILLSDDTSESGQFYEKNGFKPVSRKGCIAWIHEVS